MLSGNTSPRSAGTFERSPTLSAFDQPPPAHTSSPVPRAAAAAPSSAGLLDPRFTTWAAVTSHGARISLPDCGVVLTVPEGAVQPGVSRELFVSVVTSQKSGPKLSGGARPCSAPSWSAGLARLAAS